MYDWHPKKLNVRPEGNRGTVRALQDAFGAEAAFHYAEIGIYEGATAQLVLERFPGATVHLFDYQHRVNAAAKRLKAHAGRLRLHGNSNRLLDSYNWALMKLLAEAGGAPVFDYVLLDGAHTVALDVAAFCLCDRLLKPGGLFEFDDYGWRLRNSSFDPKWLPAIAELHTDEQIDAYQVKLIVDHLVKPDPRYEAVTENRLYRKRA